MTQNHDQQPPFTILPGLTYVRRSELRCRLGRCLAALAAVVLAGIYNPAGAADLYWVGTGGGATVASPSSGNWDTSTLAWNNVGSGTANSAWTIAGGIGSTAIFGGAGAYTATLTASLTGTNIIQFDSGAPTIVGSGGARNMNAGTGVSGGLAVKIAAGVTATLGANAVINQANNKGYSVGQVGNTPSGTLVLDGGSLTCNNSGNSINIDGSGTMIDVKTGGTFNNSNAGTGAAALNIASGTGSSATVLVEGGTVSVAGANMLIAVGGGGAGTLTLNSGTVSMPTTTTKSLTLASGAGASGVANLNGGTMRVLAVAKGAGSSAVFNFNGGTLMANANSLSFMTGLDAANVRNGGAVINSNGKNITIAQALLHSTIDGDNAVDGGLTKLSTGILTLAGANTYSGDTTVNGGTLALDAAGTLSYYIGANGVNNKITGNGTGALTLNGTFKFDLSGADNTAGNSWLIVDLANVTTTFGSTFAVFGFAQNGTQWTSGDYLFDQANGTLSIVTVPEPGVSRCVVLGLGLLLAASRLRRGRDIQS